MAGRGGRVSGFTVICRQHVRAREHEPTWSQESCPYLLLLSCPYTLTMCRLLIYKGTRPIQLSHVRAPRARRRSRSTHFHAPASCSPVPHIQSSIRLLTRDCAWTSDAP